MNDAIQENNIRVIRSLVPQATLKDVQLAYKLRRVEILYLLFQSVHIKKILLTRCGESLSSEQIDFLIQGITDDLILQKWDGVDPKDIKRKIDSLIR